MSIQNYLNDNFFISLNNNQAIAVEEINNNCLLLAVPGSGKTTVLVARVANLIFKHKVDAKKILVLTFSRETVSDIKKRFSLLFPFAIIKNVEILTIHSFCFRLMKRFASCYHRTMPKLISTINNGTFSKQTIRNIYKQLNGDFLTDDSLEYINRQISYSKNMMFTEDDYKNQKYEVPNFYELFNKYEDFKKQHSLIDFDDMLSISLHILRNFPDILSFYTKKYQYINIDEAQDTTKIQHEIIKIISRESIVFMVGDEDQTVYSFLGAYPQALLKFSDYYEDAVLLKLEQNYRSNSDIVIKANRFIKRNKMRYQKEMYCNNNRTSSIKTIRLNDFIEQYDKIIKLINDKNDNDVVAILYRNNDSSVAIIDKLLQEDIDFYIKDNNKDFFGSMLMRDIRAIFSFAFDSSDFSAFKQIYFKIGITRAIYEYVEKTYSHYNSIFECILSFNALSDRKEFVTTQLAINFKKLVKMNAIDALRCIENKIGYKNYIVSKFGLHTQFGISAMQKLNVLKSIATANKNIVDFLNRLDFLQNVMQQENKYDNNSKVWLSTIHSAKGLEFDEVILVDMIQNILPSSDAIDAKLEGNDSLIENESRLFYVGITRAKNKISIFTSNSINGEPIKTSKFVDEFVSK
ncbi:MAG: ATP-dependent helicase [Oscillospiraceae bacterium]